RGKVIGVMEVINRREGVYGREDLEVLEILAAQAAMALVHARMQRELQAAEKKISALEEMKANFVAIASHELRTPLGLILGFATHLREILPAEQRHFVEPIIRGALRLKELTEGLSYLENFDRKEAILETTTVNLYVVVRQVVEELRPLADEHRVTVEVVPGETTPLVEGDQAKLTSALRQVVKNAIQFNKPQGKVRVHFAVIPGYVKVMVEDTGIGIPQEDLERIFDRFYQVEHHLTRQHGGMGLGLAIARTLIEAHGGQIWAESEEGQGSRFSILLPVRRQTLSRKPEGEMV
ncbi:hypothetical protein D6833_10320, partial [Candidatus Parcubacteria bacterium]